MNKIEPKILKGFRDFLPAEARKRQYVIDILKSVFESYGFEPLETPALEYEEILLGKYGEEGDKLMYRFTDNGGRKVALRYDQTVPLARVVAQYGSNLPTPFKRYQIQPVWRGENPQKGRFREFLQCDVDTVGTRSLLADAEIISCALESVKKLGFTNLVMNINDRKPLVWVEAKYMRMIDKLPKIGRDEFRRELLKDMSASEVDKFVKDLEEVGPSADVKEVFDFLKSLGFEEGRDFKFNQFIVRGLDYYSSLIFELLGASNFSLSLGGGGRYDNLIGIFSKQTIPAVGFSFGFDRLIEAMEELRLFPANVTESTAKVLVTVFDKSLLDKSMELCSRLRSNNMNVEMWLDPDSKLDKQIKYADKKGIPFVAIIGPDEVKNGKVTIKNLRTGKQETIPKQSLKDYSF